MAAGARLAGLMPTESNWRDRAIEAVKAICVAQASRLVEVANSDDITILRNAKALDESSRAMRAFFDEQGANLGPPRGGLGETYRAAVVMVRAPGDRRSQLLAAAAALDSLAAGDMNEADLAAVHNLLASLPGNGLL